jgi:hypothetical protein
MLRASLPSAPRRALAVAGVVALLTAEPLTTTQRADAQVTVRARAKRTLVVAGQVFKDLNRTRTGASRSPREWRISCGA